MTTNWDALVGVTLFLAGTWAATGPRVAGGVAMLIGALYLARSLASLKDSDAAR